ncbi:MAG: hypothetical protein CME14_03995 [Gemmatimonadetes bacterium]|nr:hypothetical protein [Gemmatimonadota bacterium]|tara:strand:- start:6142 stop:7110 length:969 start_codon:yes stop_codon:yes gene_type:complete
MKNNSPRSLGISALSLILIASASLIAQTPSRAKAQESYSKGQNISPAYEGWEQNPDGSFNFLFGYINRNWLEEPDIPVGVDNSFSPGSEDQGQPTHFLPRRNRFVFKVRVPEDWGDKELVWTLTSAGKTEKAYASLRLDYVVDNMIIASETGALNAGFSTPASRANTPPVVMIQGDSVRSATVGQRVMLVATVDDDGLPRVNRSTPEPDTSSAPPTLSAQQLRPPSRITVAKVNGLHLSWFVFRGEGEVMFDPFQVKVWEDSRTGGNSPWSPLWSPPPVPEDMRWEVGVTFDRPGTYVLRGRADDGGLYGDTQVRFIVAPIS